jgi:RNA polymerase sigma-70 factor (ECF subfamily)
MTVAQTGEAFETTQWSMVLAAPNNAAALEKLLRIYWGPIYAYIRRTGAGPDAAIDLTQDFIARVMLERGLIERADPDRGRFRAFVKSALRNYLTDQHRREHSRDRAPAAPIAGSAALELLEPAADADPSQAFDRQWAATLLSRTLERVESECEASGQRVHWAAFHAAVIGPALADAPPPPLEAVAREINVDSPDRVSSLIQTVRRKFRRTLEAVVEETLADRSDAGSELELVRSLLTI